MAVAVGQSQPLSNILVWGSLSGIISVRLLRSCGPRGSTFKERDWNLEFLLRSQTPPPLSLSLSLSSASVQYSTVQ
jgi:hypothetical protein